MRKVSPPPPWVMILLGSYLLYLAYKHFGKMADFEDGLVDRVLMRTFMIAIYDLVGFWPTVILPFVFAGALTVFGTGLQVRDLRARFRGDSRVEEYEPVRWKGLVGALLVALAVIVGIFLVAFSLTSD